MLLYIYWDPDPKFFTIPFFQKTIVWYGVLFALGFFLGYLIFEKLVREFFCKNSYFQKHDISSFSRLLMSLNNNKDHPFIKNFFLSISPSIKEKIVNWNFRQEISEAFKKDLVDQLNAYLDVKTNLAIVLNDVKLRKSFLNFKTREGKVFFPRLKKRLKFEELFPEVLTPLYVRSKTIVERIFIYILIGTVIGSRLGHILFYENLAYYLSHPVDIIKTWEGGLASHGGVVAIILSFVIFHLRYKKTIYPLTIFRIMDFSVISVCVAGFFIRIGNFINQEVLGVVTDVPWAVVFGHPLDGSFVMPRHPAQLYEGFFYLLLFFALFGLRKMKFFKDEGKISAVSFILGFIFRFFIEFLKEESSIYSLAHLKMGQLLSLPIVLLGVILLVVSCFKSQSNKKKWA